MKIKTIFLDFYGTMVYEDGEVISKINEKIRDASPFCPDNKEIGSYWWKKFSSLFVESYGEKFRLQRDIELESLREVLMKFECEDNSEDLSVELFDYWIKPPIFDDTLQFLEKINKPICIVSNIDRADLISAVNFHDIKVKNIITSEDVMSYKPRAEIFHRALELMGVNPEDVLHVGDSLTSDVAGAKSIGIKTCWLNRSKKINSSDVKADIECNSLLELLDYIE